MPGGISIKIRDLLRFGSGGLSMDTIFDGSLKFQMIPPTFGLSQYHYVGTDAWHHQSQYSIWYHKEGNRRVLSRNTGNWLSVFNNGQGRNRIPIKDYDFSIGVDGVISVAGISALSGGNSIAGKSNCLKVTMDNTGVQHQIDIGIAVIPNQDFNQYEVEFDYYIDSTGGVIKQVTQGNYNRPSMSPASVDEWVHQRMSLAQYFNARYFRFAASQDNINPTTNFDEIYITNLSVYKIGLAGHAIEITGSFRPNYSSGLRSFFGDGVARHMLFRRCGAGGAAWTKGIRFLSGFGTGVAEPIFFMGSTLRLNAYFNTSDQIVFEYDNGGGSVAYTMGGGAVDRTVEHTLIMKNDTGVFRVFLDGVEKTITSFNCDLTSATQNSIYYCRAEIATVWTWGACDYMYGFYGEVTLDDSFNQTLISKMLSWQE